MVGKTLQAAGHEALQVSELGLGTASDDVILDRAAANEVRRHVATRLGGMSRVERNGQRDGGGRRMSTVNPSPQKTEETSVDDVRRVRRKLSEETGNDVNRLANRARQTAEKLREKLGLKAAKP